MKTYLPLNRFMMYSLCNLPIVIGPVLFIALSENRDMLIMIILLFIVILDVAWINIMIRYIRKDAIILDDDYLQYGTKEANVSFLKVFLNKYEKSKIHLNDITSASFNKDAMSIVVETEFKKVHLNVKGFSKRHIDELLQQINQRIESNHG